MLFDVNAMTAAEFDTWLAAKVAATPSQAPPVRGSVRRRRPERGARRGDRAHGRGQEHRLRARPTLEAPINSPITIKFDNEDAGTPHNIKIFKDSIGGEVVFEGKIFPGVATETYQVGPLAKGTYPFECFVHQNMTGTLTVQ